MRCLSLPKLASVASTAPKDVVLVVRNDQAQEGGEVECRVPANRMLLSLCSDFFEAMFNGAWEDGRGPEAAIHDLRPEEARRVVSYSEGGFEPSETAMDDVLRLQDRFIMPALRAHCVTMLMEALTDERWQEAARLAATYGLWDAFADIMVWASRRTWSASSPSSPAASWWWWKNKEEERHTNVPGPCVARVLHEADFLSVSHKFALAHAWGCYDGCDDDDIGTEVTAAAIRKDLAPPPACLMWPSEVHAVLARSPPPPYDLVADIARGMASAGAIDHRRLPQRDGALLVDRRCCMAKVDVSITATEGAGRYQMLISPDVVDFEDVYLSQEVLLAAHAEYHVYLTEEGSLGDWWRRRCCGGSDNSEMYVLVRYRRAPTQ